MNRDFLRKTALFSLFPLVFVKSSNLHFLVSVKGLTCMGNHNPTDLWHLCKKSVGVYVLWSVLLVVIRIVNTFHKHLATVYFVGEGTLQKTLYLSIVCHALCHGLQILLFLNLAPVYTFLQSCLEHHVEPDSGAASVTLHEGMADVHLYIFICNFVEGGFWHVFHNA